MTTTITYKKKTQHRIGKTLKRKGENNETYKTANHEDKQRQQNKKE